MFGSLLKLGSNWIEQQKPIRIHPDKCTHARHKASTCDACMQVCPHDAIEIKNGLQVDWNCSDCGLCISVCPTEALERREESNKDFYTRVKAKAERNNRLTFVCDKQNELKVTSSMVLVSCLGQLDDTVIQLALSQGVKQFAFLSECNKCTLKQGAKLFREQLLKWQEQWPDLDWKEVNQKDIETLFQVEESEEDQNIIERREFFKVFGKEAKQVVVESIVTKEKDTPWKDGQLSSQESIRLQVQQKWIRPNLNERTITEIKKQQYVFNEKCTSCQICEKVCPTGAIVIDVANKEQTWQQEQCVACNLCIDVCYWKGISLD